MNTKEINALQIQPPPPTGVEGWLLFLCLALALFAPLADFYHIIFSTAPRLVNAHTFKTMFLLSVYSTTFAGLGIFSVIAGVRLWLIKPGAVKLARRYLWTYLIANIGYFVFWIAVMRPKQLESFAAMGWYHVAGPIGAFALWSVYLEHSKRVRTTYVSG
jgi:hypothetical protein